MQTLTPQSDNNKKFLFLLIGPWDKKFEDIGSTIYRDLDRVLLDLDMLSFDVLVLSVTNLLSKSFPPFYQKLQNKEKLIKLVVLIPKDFDLKVSISLFQKYPFHGILETQSYSEAEPLLIRLLEIAQTEQQNESLSQLAALESQKLKTLKQTLEEKVDKRTKFLTEARRKSFVSNLRNEAFKKVLTIIHEAQNIDDLESMLNKALLNVIELTWIKICSPADEIEFEKKIKTELNYQYVKLSLYENESSASGTIFFMRQENLRFSKEEHEFLEKISEFISLAFGKIKKLQELHAAQKIWESTFQAFSEPILIIDENYGVLQTNLTLPPAAIAPKCYELLFQLKKPCENCQRGKKFELFQKKDYEVFSQSLKMEPDASPVFVNFYHDISHRKKIELQLIENAKMAELGTIGSSIAHELNNPLGGMLSFAQLIKNDLPPQHRHYEDIVAIESGIQRSKEIVQNLLSFSRKSDEKDFSLVSFTEAFERALSIAQLSSKHLSMSHFIDIPQELDRVKGSLNLISQALKNIFVLVFDLISKSSLHNLSYKIMIHASAPDESSENRLITITAAAGDQRFKLHEIQPDQLTLKILEDHHIQLSRPTDRLELTILRPVFRSRTP